MVVSDDDDDDDDHDADVDVVDVVHVLRSYGAAANIEDTTTLLFTDSLSTKSKLSSSSHSFAVFFFLTLEATSVSSLYFSSRSINCERAREREREIIFDIIQPAECCL